MSKVKEKTKANGKAAQEYSREQYETWYYQMMLMRRFEERCAMLYGQQKIRGFCHLYIGQEAVGAGVESAIRKDDYVITAYRDHGNALARGMSSRSVMAELYGKSTGCTKGKGGSMHMFSAEHHFYGGHGIVGAQIPLGAGMAFSSKYLGQDRVSVCLFGDGAVRQGALHETFNLAMLWKLPVIFICENNEYAMGTSVARSSNVTDLYKLGSAYDMPSYPVNGMDVKTVHEAVSDAAEHARSGEGPVYLEMKTYRYRGHSMSDPAKYRSAEELAQKKEEDPLLIIKNEILEKKIFTIEELDAFDAKVKAEVDDAVKFSEESPWPTAEGLYEDVYKGDYPYIMD